MEMSHSAAQELRVLAGNVRVLAHLMAPLPDRPDVDRATLIKCLELLAVEMDRLATRCSASARKNVLLGLDSLLATGESSYDYPIISVEHVLPQTPGEESEWITWFPSPEARAFWTHRIGNLVLLAKSVNSSARDYEFEKKKNSYFVRRGVTTFALTVPVIRESEWTPEVLKARQEKLVGVLAEHWRLNERVDPLDGILDEIAV